MYDIIDKIFDLKKAGKTKDEIIKILTECGIEETEMIILKKQVFSQF